MGQVHFLKGFTNTSDMLALTLEVPELKDAETKLSELTTYLKPQFFWRDMVMDNITGDNSLVSFDGGALVIESTYVSQGLRNCSKATLFALTLGQELSDYIQACQSQGRFWEGAVADIFGSHGVEMLAHRFYYYLQERNLPRGLFPTLRFSPGYGDWQLREQKKLIDYLDAGEIINVTENYLLQPVKSITALMGWAYLPQGNHYPQGEPKKGLCGGGANCTHCTTRACRK